MPPNLGSELAAPAPPGGDLGECRFPGPTADSTDLERKNWGIYVSLKKKKKTFHLSMIHNHVLEALFYIPILLGMEK